MASDSWETMTWKSSESYQVVISMQMWYEDSTEFPQDIDNVSTAEMTIQLTECVLAAVQQQTVIRTNSTGSQQNYCHGKERQTRIRISHTHTVEVLYDKNSQLIVGLYSINRQSKSIKMMLGFLQIEMLFCQTADRQASLLARWFLHQWTLYNNHSSKMHHLRDSSNKFHCFFQNYITLQTLLTNVMLGIFTWLNLYKFYTYSQAAQFLLTDNNNNNSNKYYCPLHLNQGSTLDQPQWPLTLTSYFQFQSLVSHGSEPHIHKRTRPKWVNSKDSGTDRKTDMEDGGDCITSRANMVGKYGFLQNNKYYETENTQCKQF